MYKRIVFIVTLIFFSLNGFTQEIDFSKYNVIDYKKPKEYIIKDISVSGIKYLDKDILKNLSGLGGLTNITIPGDDITKAIEKLWGQGLFSDVKISATEIKGDSISLNIYLKERARLSGFNIHGLKTSQEKDLKEKLKMRRGKQVTENIINNIHKTVEDYLIDKKYLNSEIEIVQIDDTVTKLNNIILDVNISKKEKIKIKDIIFEGNKVISDNKLLRVMKTTHKKNLNIFRASKFVKSDYKDDKDLIIKEYQAQGFRDAEILSDTVYSVSDKRIEIRIKLNEGKRYFFRDIDWVGNTKYSSAILQRALKIKKGDIYDLNMLDERLNMDEDALSNLYLDNGYLFFNVNPVVQKIENDSVDIQMRMYEGERVHLNKVIIKGNTKTNEHVVRRELRTRPGDLFSKSDIMRSQRELSQLGHFDPEQMGIEPININQAESEVDLEYSLVEKANDQLEVSGGWGANRFVGTLGLRFSNFAIGRVFEKGAWRPVPSGDGQTLSLRAQTNGTYYQSYSMSFTEPWFGGKKPNSFSVSIYHTIQSKTNYIYQSLGGYFKITGASISFGRRLKVPDDYFILSNSISFQKYNLHDYYDYFIINEGASNNFSFTTTFARNSVSQPIYPRRGSNFSLSLQITPPYSSFKESKWWEISASEKSTLENNVVADHDDWTDYSDEEQQAYFDKAYDDKISKDKYSWIEYHKWKFKSEWYLKLIDDFVLATKTEFGYLGYFNKDLGYSPFGSFDVGGDGMSGYSLYGIETIALRGYENSSLTPRNSTGQKNGNVYQKMNFELRYPISLKPQATIYVLGFVEAGNAWNSFDNYNPFTVKRSAGIGLRAFLPMFGLLGIDWGYGFDEIPGMPDANGGQFHFVIGQQF